jgi:hypothetical protein
MSAPQAHGAGPPDTAAPIQATAPAESATSAAAEAFQVTLDGMDPSLAFQLGRVMGASLATGMRGARLAVAQKFLDLHSPAEGWELGWANPAWALEEGWPNCEGCDDGRSLRECRTRKLALQILDENSA